MSTRFGDDGEEGMPYELWQANVVRAFSGRPGQRALRDLEAALVALPEKRLISGHLAARNEVCAIGAYVAHKRVTAGQRREAVLVELEALAPLTCCWPCGHSINDHEERAGRCSACDQRIEEYGLDPSKFYTQPQQCHVFEESDDDDGNGAWNTVNAGEKAGLTMTLAWEIAHANDERFASSTPEERYEGILAWVQACIIPEPQPRTKTA